MSSHSLYRQGLVTVRPRRTRTLAKGFCSERFESESSSELAEHRPSKREKSWTVIGSPILPNKKVNQSHPQSILLSRSVQLTNKKWFSSCFGWWQVYCSKFFIREWDPWLDLGQDSTQATGRLVTGDALRASPWEEPTQPSERTTHGGEREEPMQGLESTRGE